MAYIGNTVQTQGFAPAVDYFNGDGTTVTFTLSRPVASVAQLTAVIENVIQNPSTAFTVAGNAITFTSAPPSGSNNVWVEYTSLITTYAAISQDPSVVGDITASGGYSATGDYGNSFTDGVIMDYVTGNARITTGTSDGITLYNGGTSARSALMAITSAGNVGIGTSSPTTKLNVGGAYPTGYNSTLSQFVGSNVVQANGTGMVSISTNNATGADLGGSLGFGSYDSNISSPYPCAVISGRRESGTAGTYSGYFAVATTLSNGTVAERMRIDSSGNVGIGTTSPSGKFEVRGGRSWFQASSEPYSIYVSYAAGTNGYFIGGTSTSALAFSTADGTERMRIDSSGRVTTPYQPAFLASSTSGFATTAPGSYFGFNTLDSDFVSSNRSSGYNTSTYVYTAPVAGLYQFYIQLYMNSTTISAQWFKNGVGMNYVDAALAIYNAGATTNILNGSVIVELAAGDYIGVQPRGGSTTVGYYGGHSCFFGYLIG